MLVYQRVCLQIARAHRAKGVLCLSRRPFEGNFASGAQPAQQIHHAISILQGSPKRTQLVPSHDWLDITKYLVGYKVDRLYIYMYIYIYQTIPCDLVCVFC
jgi:hypothetical protein